MNLRTTLGLSRESSLLEGTPDEVERKRRRANAEQVRRGMAWVFDRYVKDRSLYSLQEQARDARLGVRLISGTALKMATCERCAGVSRTEWLVTVRGRTKSCRSPGVLGTSPPLPDRRSRSAWVIPFFAPKAAR